jgi:hypothetical protein
MNFHPLRAPEKKESESEGGKVPDTEELRAVDIKDRNPVQEADLARASRAARCHSRDAFQNVVSPTYLKRNIISLMSAT